MATRIQENFPLQRLDIFSQPTQDDYERAKDKARLLQFIEAHALDRTKFEELVERHQLVNKWRDFQQQFLNEE